MYRQLKDKVAVLFDLDGVLIDTESLYTVFWDKVDDLYPTGVENFSKVIKGNTLDRILATYYPNKDIQKRIIDILKEYENDMKYVMFDGVIDFLTSLRDYGIPIAIVTSSNDAKMSHLFAQIPELATYPEVIITDKSVKHGKPDPECYLLAASKLGFTPDRCVVFEDSIAGIKAGIKAGAKVVALATTLSKDVLKAETNIVLDSIKDISVKNILDLMSA
jgi:HAD superfamily hydrolase (TIGR01509 family)